MCLVAFLWVSGLGQRVSDTAYLYWTTTTSYHGCFSVQPQWLVLLNNFRNSSRAWKLCQEPIPPKKEKKIHETNFSQAFWIWRLWTFLSPRRAFFLFFFCFLLRCSAYFSSVLLYYSWSHVLLLAWDQEQCPDGRPLPSLPAQKRIFSLILFTISFRKFQFLDLVCWMCYCFSISASN